MNLIFDFDGVIADTERLHMLAFQRTLASRGLELPEADYFSRYLGFSDRDVFTTLLSDRGVTSTRAEIEQLVAEKKTEFAAGFAAGQAVFPAAAACIRRFATICPIAIASGACRSEIEAVLSAADLLHFFTAIVSADDPVRGKPAPDPYLEAARRLGHAPSSCVAIEDSPWGLQSAIAAGMTAVGVTTYYEPPDLAVATVIVRSLDEITEEMLRAAVETSRA